MEETSHLRVTLSIQLRILRRSMPIAWDQMRLVHPTGIALGIAIAALWSNDFSEFALVGIGMLAEAALLAQVRIRPV